MNTHAFRHRALCSLAALTLFASCQKDLDKVDSGVPVSEAKPVTMSNQAVTTKVAELSNGYIVSKPSDYDQTDQKYPLILFAHGAGQYGNGSADQLKYLLWDGMAKLVAEGRFPGNIVSGDRSYSFIVFTPQFRSYAGSGDLYQALQYAKANFRVDPNRVYVAGLSVGGVELTNMTAIYPNEIAAVIPMGGVPADYDKNNNVQTFSSKRIAFWVFHSQNDDKVPVQVARNFVQYFNNYNPSVAPRLTVWPDGTHDSWTRAINPDYKEGGVNIYEWLLQYRK